MSKQIKATGESEIRAVIDQWVRALRNKRRPSGWSVLPRCSEQVSHPEPLFGGKSRMKTDSTGS